MKRRNIFVLFMLLGSLLVACSGGVTTTPTFPPVPTPRLSTSTVDVIPTTPLPSQTPRPTLTQTQTAAPTFTTTASPTATVSVTPSPLPTYGKLRAEVTIAQAVCHYGPGAPYLYKYGVYQGSNIEIIARDERGVYVEIQAIGGNNPCWVKAEYLKIKGDLETVRPIPAEEVRLPMSPYYGPLTGVSARRDGDEVTVFWHPLGLRAGDDSEQVPYLVEAWVCKAGQLVFTPLGSYQTALKITDEPGCAAPSYGRVYGVEKHGYTRWVKIPWPQANATPSAP